MASFDDKIEAAVPALWRYALSLTGDASRADDLLQDCIERALRKRLLYLPGRDIVPWLMRMMINLYRNQIKSSGPLNTHRFQLDEPDETMSDPIASTRADHRLELADTLAAVRALPDEQREALLTVVVGGLDYRDAAKALDIPMGTLMSRLHRARTKLKEKPQTDNLVTLVRRPQ